METLEDWDTQRMGRGCPLCWPRPEVNEFWYFVARLEVSSLYLSRDQAYRGASQLIYDTSHVTRVGELSLPAWSALSRDLYRAEIALTNALRPDHINVAMLGNIVPHLHWHLIPRYRNDPRWGKPIWMTKQDEMPVSMLSESEYPELAALIGKELAAAV